MLHKNVVISDNVVVNTTIFVANGASPSYFDARIAVVAPAGIAVRRVDTPFTVPSTGRIEQAVNTINGIIISLSMP